MSCPFPVLRMTVEDPGTAASWDASKKLATLQRVAAPRDPCHARAVVSISIRFSVW
jgi:hypothetical protein